MKLFALFTIGVIALTAASNNTTANATANTTANATNESSSAAPDESSSAAPDNSTDGNTTNANDTNTNVIITEAPNNDAGTTAAFVAGDDLKVEIVSSIGFAEALNDTMQATVKDAFCADVKSTLALLGVTTVVPTCTIDVTPATYGRRRLLAATSYDLKAEVTVPAASGLSTAVNAGLAAAIPILDNKLLANPTMTAANGNVTLTVTTTQTTVSVPASASSTAAPDENNGNVTLTVTTTQIPASASSTAAPDENKVFNSGTGRACMVPSAIVFVLASSLFN